MPWTCSTLFSNAFACSSCTLRLPQSFSAVMICHALLCYVMLWSDVLCYVCYAVLCYGMTLHVMLCYVMLCYDPYIYACANRVVIMLS